jgi:hypothetical protein
VTDDELLAAVREQRDKIPMTVPVEQVISRGRALRSRRRTLSAGAALAAAACVAVAVTALPVSHPASHRPGARLTAWTVLRQPGGDVAITIRELYYPAGLRRTLRADGLPAHVSFDAVHRYPPSCRAYPASRALLRRVFPLDPRAPLVAIVIRPSALPAGTAVYLNDTSNRYGYIGLTTGLVHVSKLCTGG